MAQVKAHVSRVFMEFPGNRDFTYVVWKVRRRRPGGEREGVVDGRRVDPHQHRGREMDRYVRILVAAFVSMAASAAGAETCGVVTFGGEGELVNERVLTSLTRIVADDLDGTPQCDLAEVYAENDVAEGCARDERCLRRLARRQRHDRVVVGTLADGEGGRAVVLRMRLYGRPEGAFLRSAERTVPASRDELLAQLPALRIELFTGAPPPTAEQVLAEHRAVAEQRLGSGPSCGVLPLTGRGRGVDDEVLADLTALVGSEIDISPECSFTIEHEQAPRRCTDDVACLASLAAQHGHDRLIVGRVSAGSHSGHRRLRLQLFDATRGGFVRDVDEQVPTDPTALRIELPPLTTELMTGERPPTALEILAQQQADDLKLDLPLGDFELDDGPDEDVIVIGDDEALQIVDLEMTASEQLADQAEQRHRQQVLAQILVEDDDSEE
jgi:hypothetical protein